MLCFHTYYSLCYGTLSTEEMLDAAQKNGYTSVVVCDINNTSACIDAVRLGKEKNMHVITGIDFRNQNRCAYVGIAINAQGFRELNEHLSEHLHHEKIFEEQAPEFKYAYIIYPFQTYKGQSLRENEFIGVKPDELRSIPFSPARGMENKMVIGKHFSFLNKKHFNAHRLLRAIDKNVLLSKLATQEQAGHDEYFIPYAELTAHYQAYPRILYNTRKILESEGVDFGFGKFANKNLKHYTQSEKGDMILLQRECEMGLRYRYDQISPEVNARVEKELKVIGEMGFASYFLINWDIVRYAQSKNYYYVGRGSGANSMVAYLLRITDVDPLELDLYFERFINPFRSNPPDFDIDFSWTDRDDITHYIFKRFGHERTALLGAYNTFQHDAVTRELGKVFGLPPGEIDKIQNPQRYGPPDSIGNLVVQYSRLIHGFPSHLSIHSSGILISQEPISAYSATFMPPKGYPTTQFSMLEAEDIGLYKFDILSQRGLAKIKDALEIIQENKGEKIDIHNLKKFKRDEKVKQLLSEGKCIGCFYIESPAMRMLLAKLRADDYLRLVAASSIIRPGVAKSGMMREYILRYRNEERRKKAREELPALYDLLEETYGVMVYQEDVIKVAHYFAGLSLAEADYLRRGMSWKFKQRNEFWRVKENFFSNCKAKGYKEKTIEDIWNQIESFANYAFSKGHSASYAVESYQALYLKAYYPLEYLCATLNNGGGFYRAELYVHEARMHGAEIHPPCVNNSSGSCEIIHQKIYIGLGFIRELSADTIHKIVYERKKKPYKNLSDFVQRVQPGIETLRLLIRAGAFHELHNDKKKLLWEAHGILQPIKKQARENELFEIEQKKFKLPELHKSELDDAFDEMELLGFPLCSPFLLLKEKPRSSLSSAQLKKHLGQKIEICAYLITIKHAITVKGERMHFGTFIDCEGHWVDTVHFPPSVKSSPFTGPGCYVLYGKVVEEFEFISIEVEKMQRMNTQNQQ